MELKKAPPPVSDINVTPMVDVMLVVLIIFMVITPMLQKGVNIDMAKARNPIAMPDADKEDAVKVAMTRDGKVFLSPGTERDQSGRSGAQGARICWQNRPVKTVYISRRCPGQVCDGGRRGG